MSVASRFKTVDAFPYCIPEPNGGEPWTSYVSNVSLADAMEFLWNVESVTFTFSGTVEDISVGIFRDTSDALVCAPISSTKFTYGTFGGPSAWIGVDTGAQQPFAGLPQSFTQPNTRVCSDGDVPGVGAGLAFSMGVTTPSGSYRDSSGAFNFLLRRDPVNVGMYRIYYLLDVLIAYTGAVIIASMLWSDDPSEPLTPITSGTFSIGGISFPYYSYMQVGASFTGGTMTSSTSLFTY